MDTCKNCGKQDNLCTIQCDGCQGGLHLRCAQLSENEAKTRAKSKSLKVFCSSCNANLCQINDFKALLSSIKDDFNAALLNVRLEFEMQLSALKESLKVDADRTPVDLQFEDVVQEVMERQKRKTNIIVYGIAENSAQILKEDRALNDRQSVSHLLGSLKPSFNAADLHIHRLGRFNPANARPRPLKISLANESDVHDIIRRAKNLKDISDFKHVSISYDRTPKQLDLYRRVKADLDERARNGERDLAIRYKRGIPTIVHLN